MPVRRVRSPRDIVLAEQPESELQRQIEDLCGYTGLLHFHTRMVARCPKCGERAIATGSNPGFPDLVIPIPRIKTVLFAELKSMNGRLDAMQSRWANELQSCERVRYELWRPSDWEAAELLIKGY